MKRITVDLDEGLYKRLHIRSVVTDESMSDIVRRTLNRTLPHSVILQSGDEDESAPPQASLPAAQSTSAVLAFRAVAASVGDRAMSSTLDVQWFPQSSTWVKPAKAAVTDVILIGGPAEDGTPGEIVAKTVAADTLPDTVDLLIGAGGFGIVITHLHNDGTHETAPIRSDAAQYAAPAAPQYPIVAAHTADVAASA